MPKGVSLLDASNWKFIISILDKVYTENIKSKSKYFSTLLTLTIKWASHFM